jgi:hypothetical protein
VDERHLFVWVDSTDMECFAPLSFGTLPTTQPTLTEGVDKVWVAADLPGPDGADICPLVCDTFWAVGVRDHPVQGCLHFHRPVTPPLSLQGVREPE